MKAFDFWYTYKWRGKQAEYTDCKQTWIAALKWTLNLARSAEYGDGIIQDIEEELKNE